MNLLSRSWDEKRRQKNRQTETTESKQSGRRKRQKMEEIYTQISDARIPLLFVRRYFFGPVDSASSSVHTFFGRTFILYLVTHNSRHMYFFPLRPEVNFFVRSFATAAAACLTKRKKEALLIALSCSSHVVIMVGICCQKEITGKKLSLIRIRRCLFVYSK